MGLGYLDWLTISGSADAKALSDWIEVNMRLRKPGIPEAGIRVGAFVNVVIKDNKHLG